MRLRNAKKLLLVVGGSLLLAGGGSRANAAIDQLWTRHYASASYFEELDRTLAVVSDAQGNVFTAGTAYDTLTDTFCYVTTKYNEWGRVQWRTFLRYPQWDFIINDSLPSVPKLLLDTSGNIYMGETEQLYYAGQRWNAHGIRVVKYRGSDGAVLWNQNYAFGPPPIDQYLGGMAYDSVYHSLYLACTKLTNGGASYDWGIERINPADGAVLWDTNYSQSPGVAGATDFATGIAIGPGRDPVVCGACYNQTSTYYNWTVARFNRGTGARTWANPWRRSDTREDDEQPWGICANDSGVYVAGFVYANGPGLYGYALAKFRPDSASSGSVVGFAFDEGYLRAASLTSANGGRAYAAGTVWNYLTGSYDWFTLACSTGNRPNDALTEKWQAIHDSLECDDYAFAVQTDGLGRPWVMGSVDKDSVVDWTLRRYNPANGMPLGADLNYTRHDDDWNDMCAPTGFALRDTNHIYVGGFTVDDSFNDNHTVVRFGARIVSAVLDSLRDSTFAWRDTVDSGTTVRPRVSYHNNGYSLAAPRLRTSVDPGYADSTQDVEGAPPDSARHILMPRAWTPVQRGPQVLKCTLDLPGDTSPDNNRLYRNVYVRVRDVGPDQIILADTVEEGAALTPQARIRNYGNATAVNFPVTFRIGDSIRTTVVPSLKPDSVIVLTFTSLALSRGRYRVRVYTAYAADFNRFNDTLTRADSLFIRYRDVSCRGIIVPVGSYNEDTVIAPAASFKNNGNVSATFKTHFLINPVVDNGPVSPIPVIALPGLNPQSRSVSSRQSGTEVLPVGQLSAGGKKDGARRSSGASGSVGSSIGIRRSVSPSVDLPYRESLLVTLAPGESVARSYPNWTASPAGAHRADCYTQYSGDRNRLNDTAHSSFTVGRHDVGVAAILAPRDTVLPGNITPRATVHNYGTSTENFKVFFRIAGGTPWADSVTAIVGAGRDSTLSFRNWAATAGNYSGKCSTALAADAGRGNDTLSAGFVVAQRDVGVEMILAPRGVLDSGTAAVPRAVVRNLGTVSESFLVRFTIGSFYADSQPASLAPGVTDTIDFLGWIAGPLGLHVTSCSTMLAGDVNPTNNRMTDSVRVIPLTGLEQGLLALPPKFTFDAPSPNPVRAQMMIRYGLPREARVAVGIYSSAGVLLKSLYRGNQIAGYYSLPGNLSALPEGVYYCRLVSDEFQAVRKLVKVR